MHDIFLSYSKENQLIAQNVAVSLEKEGFNVWWDRNIATGQTWDAEIEKAIENCRCVIVLWSKASVTSEWVRIEANEGVKKNRLIPVRIEEVEPPLAFRRKQFINLIDWSNNAADLQFRKLVEDIKRLISTENDGRVHNSKPRSKPQVKSTRTPSKVIWLIPTALAMVVLIFVFKSSFMGATPNPDEKHITPIVFNVKKDALTLIFHSKTLARTDTFAIENHHSISFLKTAIERHYNFTMPADYAAIIAKGEAQPNSYLVVDHRACREEQLSLKNAGFKDFDTIEFRYELVYD